MRVEAVEASDLALHDAPALGGVGVRMRQRHKIRWEGGVAIHSYAMGRLLRHGGARNGEAQRGGGAGESGEKICSHFVDNSSARYALWAKA